ncbi:MAG TPA: non-heme iron oxygenase ferredoxin subunit [Acidimicrobiales bacterium]
MSTKRIGRLDDMAPCSVRQVTIDGIAIAVVRVDDDVYAINDRCSHQNISLSEGEVLCEERQLECWKHGSAFSLVDGEPHALPATKPVAVYQARVVDGEIEVTVDV